MEEQKTFNAKLKQRIDTMESSLNQKLDVLQSDLLNKIDILQNSISRLTNQHVHQEEESLEEEWLSETMVEKQCLQQLQEGLIENFESSDNGSDVCPWEKKEETSPMLTEEGSGKQEMEEPQKPTAQATNNPLPAAPSTNEVYILPIPTTQSTPKTPVAKAKAIPSALPV